VNDTLQRQNKNVFTARCTMCVARYCYSTSSVRPSVGLSVTLVYHGRMYWVSLKIITRIISSVSSLLEATTYRQPKNSGGIGAGSLFSAENLQYLWNGARQDQGYYRKFHARFRLVPKSIIWDDLERLFRTLFQNARVFGAYHENLNEDRPMLSAAKM